jgi:NAD(P)-dependent dehydrogenase (short-subunit alcohol dehydrogenase family)
MTDIPFSTALIVGAGPGVSASLARALSAAGLKVGLAARDIEKLAPLAAETGAKTFEVDAADPAGVAELFADVDERLGVPDVVVYNASARVRGRIAEIDPEQVRRAIEVTAFGGFLVTQQAAIRMTPKGRGAILLTGATASVKGFPLSSSFAMGKFALRGLAQSLARELSPQGIHVAHVVIDGGIRSPSRADPPDKPDSMLDPDAIAADYAHLIAQPRSAWTHELELRPWVEKF